MDFSHTKISAPKIALSENGRNRESALPSPALSKFLVFIEIQEISSQIRLRVRVTGKFLATKDLFGCSEDGSRLGWTEGPKYKNQI
jgi:hypothetical protein